MHPNPWPPAHVEARAGELASLASWLSCQQLPSGGIVTGLDLVIADESSCTGLRPGGCLLAAAEARSLAQVGGAWLGGCCTAVRPLMLPSGQLQSLPS